MVQHGRPSHSSRAKSVRSSFRKTIMGKAILENPAATRSGKRFLIGNVYDIKLTGKKNKTLIRCGKCSIKKLIWENQHLSLIMNEYLGCVQRQCKMSKDIDKNRTMFKSRNFAGENWKLSIPSKSSYFFMVLSHGWSCEEVCGTKLWVGKQDDAATLQSIYSMHRWPPLQRRRNEICWRIFTSMLPNCSKMFLLGTNWTTWYSIVSE